MRPGMPCLARLPRLPLAHPSNRAADRDGRQNGMPGLTGSWLPGPRAASREALAEVPAAPLGAGKNAHDSCARRGRTTQSACPGPCIRHLAFMFPMILRGPCREPVVRTAGVAGTGQRLFLSGIRRATSRYREWRYRTRRPGAVPGCATPTRNSPRGYRATPHLNRAEWCAAPRVSDEHRQDGCCASRDHHRHHYRCNHCHLAHIPVTGCNLLAVIGDSEPYSCDTTTG